MSVARSETRSVQSRLSRIRISPQVFSWCFLGACFWLVLGISLDAWAHNHFRLETFWTPWHGVLYSGLLATAFVLPGAMLINRLKGTSWRAAIPAGYEISVLGIIGSFISGLGDMTWHLLFGIEQNIDAAFSPTHIALMLFFGFVIVGPFHALYVSSTRSSQVLLLLSYTLLLLYWQIISQEASPYATFWLVNAPKTDGTRQTLAIVSYVLQGAFLAGLTMYLLRRWKLFFGFFFIALTISAAPLATMQNNYIVIPIGAAAGLLIDCAYLLIRPSLASIERFRLFIASVPGIWLLTYTIVVSVVYGTVWSTHLLVGSIVVTSIISWLLSGLMFPPTQPQEN
ncbi:MAG: hypothetical protein NVS4B11_31590 [Ktedonobacteraceae bacterium]